MKCWNRFLSLLVACASALGLASCGGDDESAASAVSALPVTGQLEVAFLKVGKADAIVVTTPNCTMVIDTGETDDGGKVLDYLLEKCVNTIDYLIITHFDRDHVGGAERVLNFSTVKQVYQPDYEGVREEYSTYVQAVTDQNIPVTKLRGDAVTFMMDDVQVTIDPPQKASYEQEPDNDQSLVIRMQHGSKVLLLTGDAAIERLGELLKGSMNLRADLLKVPHHGNYNDNSRAFLNAVRPAYAVICDSNKNEASGKIMDALESMNSRILETKDGDILCVSDGEKLTLSQDGK